MNQRVLFTLVGALLISSACFRRGPRVLTPEPLRPVLASARVYYNDAPAFRDSVRRVVRDRETWRDVWRQATSVQPDPPPLPEIDFDSEMIIVAAAGRMSPGDQIRVDSVGPRAEHFLVVVRTIAECQPFPAEAYPLEIVRVARSVKPVAWVERRERAAQCP